VTLLFSVLGTRLFALGFGKIFRPFETAAVKKDALSGRTGKVVYTVDSDSGTIHVRDTHGTLHRVRARSQYGALETGTEIVVLGYDPQQQVYEVDDAVAFVHRK
jgi:membrane protein implicated in regulation of membrane protease activity